MKKISIIIPVFNSEKYIERTLDSIKNQYEKNIEIVVVNDGSTDDSLNIIEAYFSKYDYLDFNLISKKNGGLADARNKGISECTGDYIINLDSDDFLKDGIIKKINDHIKYDFDVCFYGFEDYDEEKEYFFGSYEKKFKYFNGERDGVSCAIDKLKKNIWICQGSACYKKELLDNYNIKNYKGINQGEDFLFITSVLSVAKRVMCIEQVGVCISYRRNSMMHSKYNKTHLEVLKAIDLLQKFVILLELEEIQKRELLTLIKREYVIQILALHKKICLSNTYHNYRLIAKKELPKFDCNGFKFNIKERIELYMVKVPVLFYLVVNIYYEIKEKFMYD